MKMVVEIDQACELMDKLASIERSIDGLYGVWHALSEVCDTHLGDVRISTREGEPPLYY